MLRAALALAITLMSLDALAQSYRCVGTDGKKYYGSSVPPQCLGQPVEQLDSRGIVIQRIDAAASAGERAKKEAEEADRRKRETLAKEQGRKDTALMASYTSEKDIEIARARALESNQQALKDLEGSIASLKKRRGAPNEDVKAIDADLKVQEGALAAKKKDMDAINAKYDEDKRRFVEISKRGK